MQDSQVLVFACTLQLLSTCFLDLISEWPTAKLSQVFSNVDLLFRTASKYKIYIWLLPDPSEEGRRVLRPVFFSLSLALCETSCRHFTLAAFLSFNSTQKNLQPA